MKEGVAHQKEKEVQGSAMFQMKKNQHCLQDEVLGDGTILTRPKAKAGQRDNIKKKDAGTDSQPAEVEEIQQPLGRGSRDGLDAYVPEARGMCRLDYMLTVVDVP